MKGSFQEKAIATSFGLILLLLGLVNLVSSKNTTELVDSTAKVRQTYEILVSLTDFSAAMNIAESGRRGYIYSGTVYELERHKAAVRSLRSKLDQLHQPLDHDPQQAHRIHKLDTLTYQRLKLFETSIDLYKSDPAAVAEQTQITDQSVQLRGEIQVLLAQLKNEETRQLNVFLTRSQESVERRFLLEQLGTFLILTFFAVAVLILLQGRQRQQKVQTLEQTLAQERELSDLKLRLFSMVSHEFRTPLSVILASSQLLDEILAGQIDPSQLRNLARIQTSAKLMNQLLTDILTITRAEAGKLEYKPELLDIEAFCLNLLDDIQTSNPAHPVLTFNRQGRCGRVYLDEKLLYSILSNLLLNAVKYSPAGSPIQLTLMCDPDCTTLVVQDTGSGIAPEDQARIFEPFYRGKNGEATPGSGLGLAVVKKCLERFGGKVACQSQVGQGSTFTVYLPYGVGPGRSEALPSSDPSIRP